MSWLKSDPQLHITVWLRKPVVGFGCRERDREVPLFGLDGYSIIHSPLNNSPIISNSSDRCFGCLTFDFTYFIRAN